MDLISSVGEREHNLDISEGRTRFVVCFWLVFAFCSLLLLFYHKESQKMPFLVLGVD